MDLARDAAMAAESRRKLGEHVRECPQCAAQAAGEQTITAGLRTLAYSCRDQAAPPRVEASLKAAFRKYTPSAPATTAFKTRELLIRSGIGLAAAAVVLVSFLAPGVRGLHPATKPISKERQAPSQPEKPEGQSESSPPATALSLSSVVDGQRSPGAADRTGAQERDREPNRQSARRRSGRPLEAMDAGSGFIPLLYGEELTPLEGGQVVRVKLPRSILASFGFAVNMEIADEPVRADVVLGNDGVMRSIRFIDNSMLSR